MFKALSTASLLTNAAFGAANFYVRTLTRSINDTDGYYDYDAIQGATLAFPDGDRGVVYTAGVVDENCYAAAWNRDFGHQEWSHFPAWGDEDNRCELLGVSADDSAQSIAFVGVQSNVNASVQRGVIAGFDNDGFSGRDNSLYRYNMLSTAAHNIKLSDVITNDDDSIIVVGSIGSDNAGNKWGLVSRIEDLSSGTPTVAAHWHVGEDTTGERFTGALKHSSGKVLVYGQGTPQIILYADTSISDEPAALNFVSDPGLVFMSAVELPNGRVVLTGYTEDNGDNEARVVEVTVATALTVQSYQKVTIDQYDLGTFRQYVTRASDDNNEILFFTTSFIDGEATSIIAQVPVDNITDARWATQLDFNDENPVIEFAVASRATANGAIDGALFGGASYLMPNALFAQCSTENDEQCSFALYAQCDNETSSDATAAWRAQTTSIDALPAATFTFVYNANFEYARDNPSYSSADVSSEITVTSAEMFDVAVDTFEDNHCGITFTPTVSPTEEVLMSTTTTEVDDDDDNDKKLPIDLNNPAHLAAIVIAFIVFFCCLVFFVERARRGSSSDSGSRHRKKERYTRDTQLAHYRV
jgi:hypothetical protein